MSHNVPKTSVPYQKTYFESVAVVQNAQIKVKGTTFPEWGVFPKRFCQGTCFVAIGVATTLRIWTKRPQM
jgi:glutaredoxin-related protein